MLRFHRGRGADVPSPGLWNERCWTRFLSADERRDPGTRICGFSWQICPATYYFFGKDLHLAAMMCAHVDDLLFAYRDEGKEAVDAILNRFSVGKIEEGSFRYCGRRFSQDDDYTIHVDVRDNTRNLKPAAIGKD